MSTASESRGSGWIQTYTGKAFYPLDPRVEDVEILDIAHALSNSCRFTGHCREFYSVAQHSVFVSFRVPEADALWGLLHDASEAYLCDVAKPVKKQGAMLEYRRAEARVMDVVCDRFGLSRVEPPSVKLVDQRALATEARDLMNIADRRWEQRAEPYEERIGSLPPAAAKRMFLARFAALTGGLL